MPRKHVALHGIPMQKRLPDKVRGVSRAKLSHRFGAMTFERPRTNAHPQRALFVGIAFTDEVQNLALAPRQRLPAAIGWKHRTCRADGVFAVSGRCLKSNGATRPDGSALKAGFKAALGTRDLLDQRANVFGLLQCVFDHLLQIGPVSSGLRKLVAVFPDLTDIDQERGQGTVEIADDGGGRFVLCPRMGRGEPENFKAVVAHRAIFDPLRKLRIIKPLIMLRHMIRLTGPRPFEVNFVPGKTTVIPVSRREQGWALLANHDTAWP